MLQFAGSIKLCEMLYCPLNVTIWEPSWWQHGFTHCSLDTISSSVIFGFLLFFGSIQLFMYKKYSTEFPHVEKSCEYNFQIFILVLYPLLAIVEFILRAVYFDDKTVYGYMVRTIENLHLFWKFHLTKLFPFQILYLAFMVFSFFFAILLIHKERHYRLPSLPPRGHGIILLIFFTLLFCRNSVAIMSIKNENWFFKLET